MVVLKYPGAKNRSAQIINSFIPKHDVYLEPFFGSGAVFFAKTPCRIETINDLDDNVVCFFKMLRDNPQDLIRAISLTPFSRKEYEASYDYFTADYSLIEKARKFAVRCWMGFGASNRYMNGFRSSQQSTSPNVAKIWNNLPTILMSAAARLKNAQIEKLPALELIKRYNTEDVFIYLDPPYLPGTRKGYLCRHEMSETDHIELLKIINEHPGKVLISGYDNQLYNNFLPPPRWYKTVFKAQSEGGSPRKETLWMNYKTLSLFD